MNAYKSTIYDYFKIRILWPCATIIARSPNRSVSILLQSQLSVCLIQDKDLSATLLPVEITHIIFNSLVFKQNVAAENHFAVVCKLVFICSLCHWSMLVVANISMLVVASHLSVRQWLDFFVLLWSCSIMNTHMS